MFRVLWDISDDYEIILTQNASNALRLAGEISSFNSDEDLYIYSMDNHTSMAGLRNIFKKNIFCLEGENFVPVSEFQHNLKKIRRVIIGCPLQSNFDGKINAVGFAGKIFEKFRDQFNEKFDLTNTKVLTILDIASFVSTSKYSNSLHGPSFAPFSIYKLFGLPTSLGGLIVKNEMLQNFKNYFGGGSVKAWLPNDNFAIPSEGARGLEFGTPPFTEILSALSGLNTWENLTGGIDQISTFTKGLRKVGKRT